MTEREALKLALEALDGLSEPYDVLKAQEAIREALAQPEPGGVCVRCGGWVCDPIPELAQPEHSCVACEGNPKGNNNPCAVCGLAQPEQEPFCFHDGRNIVGKEYADHSDVFPLYTAPPQRKWVGLTDEEIEREWQFLHDEEGNSPDHHDFARAIEAAHGIKE